MDRGRFLFKEIIHQILKKCTYLRKNSNFRQLPLRILRHKTVDLVFFSSLNDYSLKDNSLIESISAFNSIREDLYRAKRAKNNIQ